MTDDDFNAAIRDLSGVIEPKTSQLAAQQPEQPEQSRCTGLLPCARRMLQGVEYDQRVACFRLAIHLKRMGIPHHLAKSMLLAWADTNRPSNHQTIRQEEVVGQVHDAYHGAYGSFGCEDPIIQRYCDPACPVNRQPDDSQEKHTVG